MKNILTLTILAIHCMTSYGQSAVELKLQLLTSDLIGEATLVKEPFFEWVKKVNAEVENHLKNENGNHDVMVLITLHKEKEASISIGAKPKMDKKSGEVLLEKLRKFESPKTKNASYSFAILAQLNKGCEKKDMDYEPEMVYPEDQRIAEFKQMGLVEKKCSFKTGLKVR